MQGIMKVPEEMEKWFESKRKEFKALRDRWYAYAINKHLE